MSPAKTIPRKTRGMSPVILGLEGPALLPEEAQLLKEMRPLGVILFKRSLVDPEQLFALTHDVRRALSPRAAIAIDQEGGRVDRLRAIGSPSPRARDIARRGTRTCRTAGALTGRLLRALGINWNLAPCVDLGLHPYEVSGIGDRSFHRDASSIVRFAGAYLEGLEAEGVAGCLKHFPGHGRARLDSHVDMPVIKARRRDLDRDLLPYARLLRPTRPVMVAHCAYPALDPAMGPATMSAPIIQGVLRGKLRHRGVVVADDLAMGAVARHHGIEDACEKALAAGNDALLICHGREQIARGLEVTRGMGNGRLAELARSLPSPPRRFARDRVRGLFAELEALARE